MTKHIKLTAVFTLLMSTALLAQEVQKETPAPTTEQSTTPGPKCSHMSDYCKKMMTAPKKGFHHSIEWGGIYGGPANQVSYRMFGHTINADMRDRDAIRMNAGYQFNPYLYVGGGVGAEFQYQAYTNPSPGGVDVDYHYTGKFVAVPIYAEIKGYLLKKPIFPFLQLRVGYAPDIYVLGNNHPTTVENSSYNNISVGVRIYSHLSITAGYLFMYQPQSITGYDLIMNRVIVDKSSPYQNRFTVGIAIGM